MPRDRRPRFPEVAYITPEIHAYKDHVTAVFWIGDNQSIGIRFRSPEHILQFMSLIMDKATKVWPDNELIKEYLSD
jgi:hypothetical protein